MTTGRWRARRECAAIAAALLLFVRCSSATKPPRETVFASSALTRLATAAAQREREEWDWIRTWQMDVDGFDPKSECVGTEAARKFFVVPNWYPNLPVKCTLCGDVKRYELFDGFGNEADWNIYLAPHKPFKYLFGGRSQSWHFVDGTQCMEAEVTPRRGLYDNRWFPYRKPADYRPPPTVCVYGPWVSEWVHDYRPEIHPLELLWWREQKEGSAKPSYLLFWVQDGSARFHTEQRFEGSQSDPWVPWAKPPKYGRYRIAYEVKAGAPALELWTKVHYAQGVMTPKYPEYGADGDEGPEHILVVDGRPRVILREEEPRDDDLGVRFSTPLPSEDDTLRGYVEVTGIVGDGACGGHLVVEVLGEEPLAAPLPPPGVSTRTRASAVALEGTVRAGTFRGSPELVADIEVRRERGSVGGNADLSGVLAVEFASGGVRTPLPWERLATSHDYRIRAIPVFPAGEVVLRMPGGREAFVPWPGMAYRVRVEAVTPRERRAGRAPGADLTGLLADLAAEGVAAYSSSTWELKVEMGYTTLREGEKSEEDESPWAEQLNEILERGDLQGLSQLFPSGGRFQSTWSLSALDETGLAPLAGPTHVRAGPPGVGGSILVELPQTLSLAQAEVVRISAVDPLGHVATSSVVLRPSFLTGEPRALESALVRRAAARASLSLKPAWDPCVAGAPHRLPARMDPKERDLLIGRTIAHQVVADRILTVDEGEAVQRAMLGTVLSPK